MTIDERQIMRAPNGDNDPQGGGKNYLLVIGIDHYPHHTTLSNAVADAKGFAEVMTSRYGFTHLVEPLYDAEATQTKIRQAIRKCESLGEHDRLVVFYSGHGWYKSKAKLGYIVPTDAKSDPNSDFIQVSFFTEMFLSSDAKHILLIVDCCFGGSFGVERNALNIEMTNKVAKELNTKRSRMVLSSGSIEPVSDGLVSANNSPFTAPLLEILWSNKQSLTVFSEVFPLLRKKTKWDTNQMPQYKVLQGLRHEDGELALFCTDLEAETWNNLDKTDKNALNVFRVTYPNSPFLAEATACIKDIEAKEVQQQQEAEAKRKADADKRKAEAEKQAYDRALANPTVHNFNQFLKMYPLSNFAENIEKRLAEAEIEAAWKEAKNQNTITAYRAIIRRFPDNAELVANANKRIEDLEAALEKEEKNKPSVIVVAQKFDTPVTVVVKSKENPVQVVENQEIEPAFEPSLAQKFIGGVFFALLVWALAYQNKLIEPNQLTEPKVEKSTPSVIQPKTPFFDVQKFTNLLKDVDGALEAEDMETAKQRFEEARKMSPLHPDLERYRSRFKK